MRKDLIFLYNYKEKRIKIINTKKEEIKKIINIPILPDIEIKRDSFLLSYMEEEKVIFQYFEIKEKKN